jgi:hypothetical protein
MPRAKRKIEPRRDNVIPFPVRNNAMLVVGNDEFLASVYGIRYYGSSLNHRDIFDGDTLIVQRHFRERDLKANSMVVGFTSTGARVARERFDFGDDFEPEGLVVALQRSLI